MARPGRRHRERTIYYSVAAQPGNLGDVEIRKVAYKWLEATDLPMKVFIGTMPLSYLEAIGLNPHHEQFRQNWRFQMSLVLAIARRRAHLVFAPGPQDLTLDRRSLMGRFKSMLTLPVKPAVNLGNALIVRVSGGKIISVGRSLRGDHPMAVALERRREAISHHYSVRDTVSSMVLRRSVNQVPDVAFAPEPKLENHDRSLLVMSLRGDRTVPVEALQGAVDAAGRLGLQAIFVTQVQSDNRQHVNLGARLNCEVIVWDGESHSDQMARLDLVYGQARAVVSNRLHALVFGARAGAMPVAIVHRGNDKLKSTLDGLLPLTTIDTQPESWKAISRIVSDGPSTQDVLTSVSLARLQLTAVGDEIRRLLQST